MIETFNQVLGVANIIFAVLNLCFLATDTRRWWLAFAGGWCLAIGFDLLLK